MDKHMFRDDNPRSSTKIRLSIWILLIPILISGLKAYSHPLSYAESTKVSIELRNKPLVEVLDAIKAQSEFSFVVNKTEVDLNRKVTVIAKEETVHEVLNAALVGTELTYKVSDKHIVIFKGNSTRTASPHQQKQRKITGVIVDATGEPIIGATVTVQSSGSTSGTLTDADGKFEISGPATAFKIEISYIGFRKQIVDITSAQNNYNIVLEEDTKLLDEIVVVGFGLQKKETVTGAISMVQTKDLVQSPQANVSNMLAGRMPGLLAVQRSGEPGADFSTLRIRGIGTFANGEGSQDPLVMVDGIETANFNNIDPNEIESLSILKDASSTAVYGVRGANGVILITTKRGAQGKPQISYSGNFAMNKFTDIRETMNSYDYARMYNEGRKYDAYITGGYTPRFSDEDIEKYRTGSDPIFYPDINWYDLILRDQSFTTQHNINVAGGVDKVKYFISGGYYNQEGLFDQTELLEGYDVQSGYERFNFRSNLDFEVSKRLSIKLNIASQMETRTGNAGEMGRVMESIAKANPMLTPGIVDGKIVDIGGGNDNNPFMGLYQNGYRKEYRNHLNGSVGVNYKMPWIEGLELRATVSYENYYRHQQKYVKNPPANYTIRRGSDDQLIFQPNTVEKPFSYSGQMARNRRTYAEAGISYNRKFLQSHNVTALLLYNQSRRTDPNLAFKVPNSYQGIVGRVTYDYKNRYLAEFNVGYNGTENFAQGRRFGFFPAYSLGWVASEESFFPKTDIVSFFKIRGSYGEVGNDRIGGDRFLYLPTSYTYGGGQYYFGEVGSTYTSQTISNEGRIGNPLLTWERAKKTNVGVEASFWKNRIRVNADYFTEKRNNILATKKSDPVLFGGLLPAENMGKMKNSGWDMDITYRDSFRDFNYWLRANYTYAHNKIEFQDEVEASWKLYQKRTGQRYGQYFGLICDGIYNTWEEVNDPNRPKSSWQDNKIQPGDLKYRDINSDGVIDSDDEVPIGYSNFPEIVYGFSFGGDWKGIDLSVLFQGATNVSLQNSRLFTRGFGENFSAPTYLEKSWSQERYEQGLPIEFPHLSEGNVTNKHNYQNSTFWTRDASYLRLKNVEIGYTFNTELLKKLRISSLRLFVNGNNLYTWSDMFKGVDPEAAQQATNYEPYPITKVYNIGLNIKF